MMYRPPLPALLLGSLLLGSVTSFPAYADDPSPSLAPMASPTLGEVAQETNVYPTSDYQTILQQLNSIQQLRDVSPIDWSYQALKNLVENYGCIVGYPDRTFRGDRPLSRNEFAAGLNACMEQLERRLLEARSQGQAGYMGTQPGVQAIPTEPGEHFVNVMNRAFSNESLRFYDNTDISGQLNKIFGWRYAPGSFFDNQIANDGKTLEAVFRDGLDQQTAGPRIRTPDIINPYNSSLNGNPQYIQTEPPSLRQMEINRQQIPIIP
ncbi:iron uptake porin [Crocosphaera sp. XPORK-15E]|uniref:iron uptake porin n=1 Tax=Crocosphaera sp. XPORK-15E TaxID=3110247 RepID=UPI002B1F56F7|nr:iron uptake porin [Crocosphaera sp. XPORK-15E]MEA5534514.1 iron uptake porin [Crocosphaera sp. XPORK-15E]